MEKERQMIEIENKKYLDKDDIRDIFHVTGGTLTRIVHAAGLPSLRLGRKVHYEYDAFKAAMFNWAQGKRGNE